MKKFYFALLVVVLVVIAFLAGARFAKNSIGDSVNEMQAELSFGHFKDYQEINTYLLSGCDQQAKARLDYAIDQEMMLMAKYVQKFDGTDTKHLYFNDYVTLRDSSLINKLRSYKFDSGKSLTLPACNLKK